jgi:Ca2+-transporting ATPase
MLSGETALPDPSVVALDTVSDEEALRPDPGTESTFQVDDNKFAYTPGQLNKFLNPKSLQAYRAVGGIRVGEGSPHGLDHGVGRG